MYMKYSAFIVPSHPPLSLSLGYMAQVTALHNMLVLAQQLQTNVHTSVSHKYIAHQLALLYVS